MTDEPINAEAPGKEAPERAPSNAALLDTETLAIQPQQLLDVIQQFIAAYQEGDRALQTISLDTSISQGAGLDSIARMELIAHIEGALSVQLAESAALAADTPRELLQALQRTKIGAAPMPLAALSRSSDQPQQQTIPDDLTTLNQVLAWHAAHNADKVHVLFLDEHANETTYTYKTLYEDAQAIAAALIEAGLQGDQAAAIMLPASIEYLQVFCGILLAGGIPVPIYPPARPQQLEDHLLRHAKILSNAHAVLLVTFDEAAGVSRLLANQVRGLLKVVTVKQLQASTAVFREEACVVADSIAFLQYTSGSTGQPKGVVLSHANVLASVRSMGQAMRARSDDVFVSWLPLYHDMGLIGAWIGSLYHGIKLVLMSPLTFLLHPYRWLEAISAYRGTISGAPNFAYELCLRRVSEERLSTLDLSSWRVAFSGAEPVHASTLEAFAARFSRCHFPFDALTPVYGLAEATLGVTIPPLPRAPRIDWISAGKLATSGRAQPQTEASEDAIAQVSCGIPIPGFEVRIADDNGDEVADCQVGHVQFRGPAATRGYFHNHEATMALFDGEWLRTGDQGYVADSELYITGRDKDVIIRAGRNMYPYDLEIAVGSIEGVRSGCVAVFGDAVQHGSERLIVVAETRQRDAASQQRIKQAITEVAARLLDVTADAVFLVPPHTVLKTSSGKIRRGAMRELYQRGALTRGRRAVWLQVARLWLAGLGVGIGKKLTRFLEVAKVLWMTFNTVLGVLVGALVMLLPLGLQRHWRIGAVIARWLMWLAGIRTRINGIEHLEDAQPKVLVVNHTSYLDAVLLSAISPRPIAFLTKQQIRKIPLLGRVLSRMGMEFVNREDTRNSIDSVETLAGLLESGRTVGMFPEGTFHRMPGVLPFRLGAFFAAAKANVAVVPITLRGGRHILRMDSWILRSGLVQFDIEAPIFAPPEGTLMQRALELRKQARALILARCGEPDLGDRHDVYYNHLNPAERGESVTQPKN